MRPLRLKSISRVCQAKLADLPGLSLLAHFAGQVPFQGHRLAADRQDDFQMGRIEAEGQAVGQVPRLQVEVEQLALEVSRPLKMSSPWRMLMRLTVKAEPRPLPRVLLFSRSVVEDEERGLSISMLIAFFFMNSEVGGR